MFSSVVADCWAVVQHIPHHFDEDSFSKTKLQNFTSFIYSTRIYSKSCVLYGMHTSHAIQDIMRCILPSTYIQVGKSLPCLVVFYLRQTKYLQFSYKSNNFVWCLLEAMWYKGFSYLDHPIHLVPLQHVWSSRPVRPSLTLLGLGCHPPLLQDNKN